MLADVQAVGCEAATRTGHEQGAVDGGHGCSVWLRRGACAVGNAAGLSRRQRGGVVQRCGCVLID